jgi:hypothetical protein
MPDHQHYIYCFLHIKLLTFQKSVLGSEIIVNQTEDDPFVVITLNPITVSMPMLSHFSFKWPNLRLYRYGLRSR